MVHAKEAEFQGALRTNNRGIRATPSNAAKCYLCDRYALYPKSRKHLNKRGSRFAFVRTGLSATEFRDRMRGLGIEVGRPFPPLTDWSRISLGQPEDNTALIAALRTFKAGGATRKVASTMPQTATWS